MVLKFSSFAAIDHKGYFRKILTEFLSLTPFLATAPSRVKKKERIKWRGRRMNWKLFRKIRHYLYNSREKEYVCTTVKEDISKTHNYIGNSVTYYKLLIGPKFLPMRVFFQSHKLSSINYRFAKCATSSKCIRRWFTTVTSHTLPAYMKSVKTLHF